MAKLSWEYDSDWNKFAMHNGYRIRAVYEQAHGNPLEDDCAHWPITVRLPDRRSSDFKDYEPEGLQGSVRNPLHRFGDAQLVHLQVHVAKALGYTGVRQMLEHWADDLDIAPVGYCMDASVLRAAIDLEFEHGIENSQLLETCAALYRLIDIPVYCGQVTGHCQGDWAETLVIGPPELIEKWGCITPITPEVLADTSKLYGDWAYGNTYAYQIEAPSEVDEDGDVIEWEPIADGYGGTYFGDDHEASGLEEAALDAVPDEAPVMPVYEGEMEDA